MALQYARLSSKGEDLRTAPVHDICCARSISASLVPVAAIPNRSAGNSPPQYLIARRRLAEEYSVVSIDL